MGGIGIILVVLGIIGLIWGLMQKFKAGRLSKAPFVKTGDAASKGDSVAGEKGAISVEGNVKCDQPLLSPVTGTPCLYYELKVIGTWKDGDSNQSKDYVDEKQAATFTLDDGTGGVKIVAGKGGDFEPMEKTFDETKKEGFFADLKNAVGKGQPMMFGKYAFNNPPMSKADKFQCVEKVVKVQPKLYALGKLEGNAIGSPSWTSLILTNKSRDELLGSTAKGAKNFLMGGGIALALGVILSIIGAVMAPKTTVTSADVKAADDTAAAVKDEAPAAGGSCEKAMKCCRIIAGDTGAAACDALANAPEATCATALASYQKAVKAAKPDQAKDCE